MNIRILFLSRWYPYPADNGSKIRIYNLIKEFARRHDVWLASIAEEQITLERMEEMCAMCNGGDVVPCRQFHPGGLKSGLGFFVSNHIP